MLRSKKAKEAKEALDKNESPSDKVEALSPGKKQNYQDSKFYFIDDLIAGYGITKNIVKTYLKNRVKELGGSSSDGKSCRYDVFKKAISKLNEN